MLNPAPAPFQDICIEPEWRKGIYMKAFQRKAWGPFNFQWRSISRLVPPKRPLKKASTQPLHRLLHYVKTNAALLVLPKDPHPHISTGTKISPPENSSKAFLNNSREDTQYFLSIRLISFYPHYIKGLL
jgi:hypothetical protein